MLLPHGMSVSDTLHTGDPSLLHQKLWLDRLKLYEYLRMLPFNLSWNILMVIPYIINKCFYDVRSHRPTNKQKEDIRLTEYHQPCFEDETTRVYWKKTDSLGTLEIHAGKQGWLDLSNLQKIVCSRRNIKIIVMPSHVLQSLC